jgi:hypothetical protein
MMFYIYIEGVWSIGPATFAKLFGVEHMAINMGFIFLAVVSLKLSFIVAHYDKRRLGLCLPLY